MKKSRFKISPVGSHRGAGTFAIVLLIVAIAMVTSLITVWLAKTYLFPREFKPVELNDRETEALHSKLARFDPVPERSEEAPGKQREDSEAISGEKRPPLTPERYDEAGAIREIRLSERELNALLAQNTNLAHKLAIDLSEDLASAKLLIPLDPEFPFFGGKTLKVAAGMELTYDDKHPVVMLKGVSIWGVPLPNAWLGNLKNVDLVKEFGGEQGFWQSFADGVENIHVEEGTLAITLKE